jgi:hypothetical protein
VLIRPRAKIVALSLRMPPGQIVIRACHDGELFLSRPVEAGGEVWREVRVWERRGSRALWELVAENPFEAGLLRGRAQFEKMQQGSRICHTWRLGKPRGVRDEEVDNDFEAERDGG